MRDDERLITLDEAAQRFFPDGSVSANTLKRRIRQGALRAYKPGKAYLTTAADIREMVIAHRVTRFRQDTEQLDTRPNDALEASLSKLRRSAKSPNK
jgi:hypothetical protein